MKSKFWSFFKFFGLWWLGWLVVASVYYGWFPSYAPTRWLAVWVHSAIFCGWFLALMSVLRLFQHPRIRRFCAEKWSFPIVFLFFSMIWIIPVAACWVGRANWSMIVTTEIIGIFLASFREMSQLAAFNSQPVIFATVLFLIFFLLFHHKRAARNSQILDYFFQKINKKTAFWGLILGVSMFIFPIFWSKTRAESLIILTGKDPFSAFFYANFKEKYTRAKNSTMFRPTISDANVPEKLPEILNKKNVIIICLDALRTDRLAAFGGPNGQMPRLDSLIQCGYFQKMEHSISTGTGTIEGIYAMLFSNYFAGGNTPTDRPSLPWLLRKAGYENHFLLTGIHRGWYGLGNFYAADATTYFEGLDSKFFNPNDDQILLEGLQKLPNFSGKPTFFYVHTMSSHVVGTKLEAFHRHLPETYDIWETHGAAQIQAYKNHYQNGVEQADFELKTLLKSFEEKGFLQNSIVWVFADHGECLGENGGILGHSEKPWGEIMRIPILFHDSDSSKLRDSKFATLTDIAPTTAARLGLPIPKKWVGKSLNEPFLARQIHIIGNESEAWVRIGTTYFEKYWINYSDSTHYFFDLIKDSTELENLWPTRKPTGWEGFSGNLPKKSTN